MKILVSGSRGQLGGFLTNLVSETYEIVGSARCLGEEEQDWVEMDILDNENVKNVISDIRPEIVINAAALTNVDACEKNPDLARLVNGVAVKNMAEACRDYGAKLFQISTDYVFDGEDGMYSENCPTSPIQEYGRSKLFGEQKAMEVLGSNVCVIRTSVVFDGINHNFVKWVMENLSGSEELKIVQDQWVCPTSTRFISESIFDLIDMNYSGIINIASGSRISRVEMAYIIADRLGVDRSKIIPINMSDLNWSASRPMDSSLDCSKLAKIRVLQEFEEMLIKEFPGV